MFRKKINLVFILFISALVTYSCVDDDVCDKSTTPRLTIGFKDIYDNKYVVDSLIVDRVNTDGTISNEGIFTKIDSVRIPLNAISDKTVFYLYNSKQTLDADKDIITVKYQTAQEFVSKACGLRAVFNNVTYELTQAKKIKALTPNTTEIHNESKNLYITY